MKEFWVKATDKNRFVQTMRDYHFFEIGEPGFRLIRDCNDKLISVVRYFHYKAHITDEEYLFLKLQFDLEVEI